MGDMGELGESSLEHHIAIFKLAREYKIKYLFYMGGMKMKLSPHLEIDVLYIKKLRS